MRRLKMIGAFYMGVVAIQLLLAPFARAQEIRDCFGEYQKLADQYEREREECIVEVGTRLAAYDWEVWAWVAPWIAMGQGPFGGCNALYLEKMVFANAELLACAAIPLK